MAVVKTYRHAVLAMACVMGLAACGGTAPAPAETTAPVAQAPAAAEPTVAEDAVAAPVPVTDAATTQACMIAGEFTIMGNTLRSRDCMQTNAASGDGDLKPLCEGLAQTSAQMGGKAGEVTYMAACPSPSQGSCKGLFGGKFDGHYYERSAEDVAGLPASCEMGGGTWVAG